MNGEKMRARLSIKEKNWRLSYKISLPKKSIQRSTSRPIPPFYRIGFKKSQLLENKSTLRAILGE